MKKKVLITNVLPSIAQELLSKKFDVTWNKKQLSEEQLAHKAAPYHALLTTLADPVTSRVLEAAPQLQCVANYAVGFNNIDLASAKAKGIVVTNTPDVLTDATADLTWALILACARRVPEGEEWVRKGRFKGWHPLMLLGKDLAGVRLGILGLGRIGKAVAERGRGWNMKVLYHQRKRESSAVEKRYNATFVPFERLIAGSDILTIHTPLTAETKGRFTSKEFKKMKRNCIFINTSRGAIHVENDLVEALKRRWVYSAGLDVYEFEPKIHPGLKKLKNCVLTPHIGSATTGTRDHMAVLAAKNIELVLTGRRPLTRV